MPLLINVPFSFFTNGPFETNSPLLVSVPLSIIVLSEVTFPPLATVKELSPVMYNRSVFSSLALIVTDPRPCKNPIPSLLDFVEIVPPERLKSPTFSIPGFPLPVTVNLPPDIWKFPRTYTPFLCVPVAVTEPPLIFKAPFLCTTIAPETRSLFCSASAAAFIVPLSIVKLPATTIPLDASFVVG